MTEEREDIIAGRRRALVEVMGDPLRAQVFGVVVDSPGATIAQISRRTGHPSRRVRHQVERLLEAGLVEVDTETQRRNTRERHYRALIFPRIDDGRDDPWTDDDRRRMAAETARLLVADIARASQHRTFGLREGHAEVRFAGVVDEEGWEALSRLMLRATSEIEEIMAASAGRLKDAGDAGIEVILGLLLFETLPWDPAHGSFPGPRPSRWLEAERPGEPLEGS